MPGIIRKYFLVTKPGIIFGNLTSVAGGFFLASRGRLDIWLLLSTLTGVALVVASGCVFNNCFDRRMDRKMERTRNRIMAQRHMSPKTAILYASLLGVTGMLLLQATTNILSVIVVLAGLILYAGVYTLYLKRTSVHATLIGSLAGAAPPLVGYCAVTNRFDTGAVILLSIFCLWQIPHSYAAAISRFQDYTAAAIPILPVKLGIPAAKSHIVGFILAFLAATLLLTLSGYTGFGYLIVASTMCLFWLNMAWSGFTAPDDRIWARKLFIFSILTIIVLNVMMSVDTTGFACHPDKQLVSEKSLP